LEQQISKIQIGGKADICMMLELSRKPRLTGDSRALIGTSWENRKYLATFKICFLQATEWSPEEY